MITEDKLKERIKQLQAELGELQQSHEAMVNERNQREQFFQQHLVNNQNRFQQLSGAIEHLKQVLNGQDDKK